MVKFYTVDDVCHACAKKSITLGQAFIEHLMDVPGCLQTLQGCFPPLSDAAVLAFDTNDHATTLELRAQGWGAEKALKPMRKLFGPCLPPPGSEAAIQMYLNALFAIPMLAARLIIIQRHAMADAGAAAPQVHLFNGDLPAFVFQSEKGMNPGDGCFCSIGLAREAAILHIRAQMSPVFVHFYSGFRRRGDFHALFEQHR